MPVLIAKFPFENTLGDYRKYIHDREVSSMQRLPWVYQVMKVPLRKKRGVRNIGNKVALFCSPSLLTPPCRCWWISGRRTSALKTGASTISTTLTMCARACRPGCLTMTHGSLCPGCSSLTGKIWSMSAGKSSNRNNCSK